MRTERHPLMIPGALPAGEMAVTAPYDGSAIARVAVADAAAVDLALATAHALYRDRDAWLGGGQRIAILEQAAALMHERREALALEAAREGGKPLADSRVEVARAMDGIKNCAELLRHEAGREIPMGINAASAGHLAFTRREPVGVVVAVSAFNHPLNLIVHQIGPAIAAGCPVIVKPARDTPLSCLRLVALLREAGLPEAWCQACVTEDAAVAERLVTDARVGFFSFIGSARVGWMLKSKLAPGTRCALEHGGVAPVILAADADLDAALPGVAKAGFYHAGQVCVSVQRVYAPRALAAQVAERLAALGAAMPVGDPTREDTAIGPLIRPREVARVQAWVDEAVAGGARLVCGGKPWSATCYPPTVLLDPPEQARVSCQEVFGPVICVYGYDHPDEAIARANALPHSFQAAIYTRDLDAALRAWRRLDASAVMVNEHTAFRVDWMPFAGRGQSGYGVGGIRYSFEEMTAEKMLVIRSAELP